MAEDSVNKPSNERKLYGGFSLFGVPYNPLDIRYAVESLFELYSDGGKNIPGAMSRILDQNERVVSRCGMLITFSGTLIALSLFVASRPDVLPALWQQYVYYAVMMFWVLTTMHLLWTLKHKLPPVWDFFRKDDFVLTAELFLQRMGSYNIALMAAIGSFVAIAFVLSPLSAVVSDKIFHAPVVRSGEPALSASIRPR